MRKDTLIKTSVAICLLIFVVSCFFACSFDNDSTRTESTTVIEKTESIGIEYTYISVSDSYMVAGIGSCKDNIVIIPSTYNGKKVTGIGWDAFKSCSSITEVRIPNTVVKIEDRAFKFCINLKTVVLPSTLRTIGEQSFYACYSLQSITIPEYVTSIGKEAFAVCTSLKAINIPDSVKQLGAMAYSNCSSMTEVIIGDGVKTIESDTFSSCRALKTLSLGSNIETIKSFAFSSCSKLTDLTIPSSVKLIERYAFSSCDWLSGVSFEKTTGWVVSRYDFDSDPKTPISVNNLATNANNLKSTYLNYVWRNN